MWAEIMLFFEQFALIIADIIIPVLNWLHIKYAH